MQRTKGMSATELMGVISDQQGVIAGLEKQVNDMMHIMAAIANTQDDKMFSVPIKAIAELKPGSSVEFSFNRKTEEYEFHLVVRHEAPGLILPASVHPDAAEAIADPTKPLEGEINI